MLTIRKCLTVWFLNICFNNNSVISWQPILLVEEIGVSGENHQPAENLLTNCCIKLHTEHLVTDGTQTRDIIDDRH